MMQLTNIGFFLSRDELPPLETGEIAQRTATPEAFQPTVPLRVDDERLPYFFTNADGDWYCLPVSHPMAAQPQPFSDDDAGLYVLDSSLAVTDYFDKDIHDLGNGLILVYENGARYTGVPEAERDGRLHPALLVRPGAESTPLRFTRL